MTAEKKARWKTRWEMMKYIEDAEAIITTIEELARQNGIPVTVNFAAELANTHDALTELEEQIRKL